MSVCEAMMILGVSGGASSVATRDGGVVSAGTGSAGVTVRRSAWIVSVACTTVVLLSSTVMTMSCGEAPLRSMLKAIPVFCGPPPTRTLRL